MTTAVDKPRDVTTDGASVPRTVAWSAMGTQCTLQFSCGDAARAFRFRDAAIAWVTRFEHRYSRFRSDSMVAQINAAAGVAPVAVDAETERVLDLCELVYRVSQGLIDATALPLMQLWDYRAAQPRVPSEPEIERTRRLVGWSLVRRTPGFVFLPERGMAIDIGGWGKEYAVDQVAELAREHGVESLLVDFGHDLRAVGVPPGRPAWHIGLEDPARPGTHRESVALRNAGMASSGDYLRGFTVNGRRFGHIIDVRTGRPVANGCIQSTVIASSCLQAGILSTASFIAGPGQGIQLIEACFGAEGMIIAGGTRYRSRKFFNYVVQN